MSNFTSLKTSKCSTAPEPQSTNFPWPFAKTFPVLFVVKWNTLAIDIVFLIAYGFLLVDVIWFETVGWVNDKGVCWVGLKGSDIAISRPTFSINCVHLFETGKPYLVAQFGYKVMLWCLRVEWFQSLCHIYDKGWKHFLLLGLHLGLHNSY